LCHRFTDLREIFQGDLFGKLTAGAPSQDFESLPCNCRTGGNGVCGHNNMCMNSTSVHKVKCNNTGKVHMGNTQQIFTAGMRQNPPLQSVAEAMIIAMTGFRVGADGAWCNLPLQSFAEVITVVVTGFLFHADGISPKT